MHSHAASSTLRHHFDHLLVKFRAYGLDETWNYVNVGQEGVEKLAGTLVAATKRRLEPPW